MGKKIAEIPIQKARKIPTQCFIVFWAVLIGPLEKLNGLYTPIKTHAYEYFISALISQSYSNKEQYT